MVKGKTHGKQLVSFTLLSSCTVDMDYIKIVISVLLVVVFYILFGEESIAKLRKGGISVSRNEEEPHIIKEPGNYLIILKMVYH